MMEKDQKPHLCTHIFLEVPLKIFWPENRVFQIKVPLKNTLKVFGKTLGEMFFWRKVFHFEFSNRFKFKKVGKFLPIAYDGNSESQFDDQTKSEILNWYKESRIS